MSLFVIQTTLLNDCMKTGVQGYMRSGFARFRSESSAVWALCLRRQEVVLRLTSGPARVQRTATPQSLMFSILSMWKDKPLQQDFDIIFYLAPSLRQKPDRTLVMFSIGWHLWR